MIFLRTQSHRSFDREFVFTALHQRFIYIHLFYSYLTRPTKPFPFRSIPSNHLLSTKRRFVGSACTAPTEGPPPSYLQHWSPSLLESINGLGFHSGHTIPSNESKHLITSLKPVKQTIHFDPNDPKNIPYRTIDKGVLKDRNNLYSK